MEDKVKRDESPAMQKTRKGAEIPVPKRKDLLDAFRKIVQPKKG
jgi:hypothetical protein